MKISFKRGLRNLCLTALFAAAGCAPRLAAPDKRADELVQTPLESDTSRVSRADFVAAHPEYKDVDFSAFGKLVLPAGNGRFEYCSAVLLEPGNLIATVQHCVFTDQPDMTYTFVTRDKNGRTHKMRLASLGRHGGQSLHAPTMNYFTSDTKKKLVFDPEPSFHDAADIAFFRLTKPLPPEVIPAKIASSPQKRVQKVFAAGYSSLVQAKKSDDGFSITKEACYQTQHPDAVYGVAEGKVIRFDPVMNISSCLIREGDSGGAHFVIKDGRVEIISIHHTFMFPGAGQVFARGCEVFNEKGFKSEQENRGIQNDNMLTSSCVFKQITYSTPLDKMRDFCINNIGPDHCTGFPRPPAL